MDAQIRSPDADLVSSIDVWLDARFPPSRLSPDELLLLLLHCPRSAKWGATMASRRTLADYSPSSSNSPSSSPTHSLCRLPLYDIVCICASAKSFLAVSERSPAAPALTLEAVSNNSWAQIHIHIDLQSRHPSAPPVLIPSDLEG